MSRRYKVRPLLTISQYDKDMCCLYTAEGMTCIWQQRENQELSRILASLADRKLMKRVHGGYAITLKGLLAVKVWRLHLLLSHHDDEYKYFRRKKRATQRTKTTHGITPVKSADIRKTTSRGRKKRTKRHARRQANEQSNPIRGMHPLRRDRRHISRHLPVLRIPAGCAQSATKEETCGLTQTTTD